MAAPLPEAMSDDPRAARGAPTDAGARDPRAIRILAKSIYRELRQTGLEDEDVMSLAGEILSLLASEVQERRGRDAAARAAR